MTKTNPSAAPAWPAKLLDINEACEALRISRWSMYQLINARSIKTVRVRGRHLIAPQDLDDFIERLRAEEDPHHA
jgi:excisionase family DNA binding protein